MAEEWRVVADYPDYEISNIGNVRSNKNGKVKLLNPANNKGYKQICLYYNGNGKNCLVHRLIAFAFIEQIGGKLTVDHIDRDPSNNNINNLRWADMKEQNRDRCTYRVDIEETDPKIRTAIFAKEYRDANKDIIEEKLREKVQCECGVFISCRNIARHRKTSDKHTKRLLDNLIN